MCPPVMTSIVLKYDIEKILPQPCVLNFFVRLIILKPTKAYENIIGEVLFEKRALEKTLLSMG